MAPAPPCRHRAEVRHLSTDESWDPHRPVVVGVDGCRAGWLVVTVCALEGNLLTVEVHPRLSAVMAAVARGTVMVAAVDMPVGLSPPRTCDAEARARLGPRRSSVFDPPPRTLLSFPDHRSANAASRAHHGRGISVQSWNLVPRIAELDRAVVALGARLQPAVRETHPELAFAVLAGAPMPHSKHTAQGVDQRRDLLSGQLGDPLPLAPPRGASAHDVLDALVLAVRASQWVRGVGPSPVRLGGEPDELGLPMEIWG